MLDVESLQSGTSEFGLTPSCLGDPTQLVSGGAYNAARVNTVEVVVGGFREQLSTVDPHVI